jgi:hypothetical protein
MHTPAVERSPADTPPDRVCDATNSMSGPGVQMRGKIVAAKRSKLVFSMTGIVEANARNWVAKKPILLEKLALKLRLLELLVRNANTSG